MTNWQKFGFGFVALFVTICAGVTIYLLKGNLSPANPKADRVAFHARSTIPGFARLLGFFSKGIYVMNVDSDGLTLVINQSNIEPTMAWSPQGDQIVYFDYDSRSLYAISTSGSDQPKLLKQGIDAVDLAWSPDGTKIAYSNGIGRIYLFDLATQKVVQLLDDSTRGGDPAWSPDGDQIVFVLNPNTGDVDSSIAVIHTDGSVLTQLTADDNSKSPEWSPQGGQIIFERNQDIYVINADGTQEKALTRSGKNLWPTWSPDGTRIAFVSLKGTNEKCYESLLDSPNLCTNQLVVMNTDGSNTTVLGAEYEWIIVAPIWAPRNL